MRVEVIRPAELGHTELALWRGFQGAEPRLRHPFLAPEFAAAVGAARDDAYVAVVEDGGEVVGFVPHQRSRYGVGRPVGAGVSDRQGAVLAPGVRPDPVELLRACRLASFEFDHLDPADALFSHGARRVVPSPVADLSGEFAGYLAGRRAASRSLLSSTERKARGLERDVGPLRFELVADPARVLPSLVRWKRAQYQRTGVPDVLARRWVRELLDELIALPRGADLEAPISALWAGERLVAAHLGLRSGDVLASWFPAYDPAVGRRSPGLVMLLRLLEAARADGVRLVDFGRGSESYKGKLATASHDVAEGIVVAAPRGAARAVRLWSTRLARDLAAPQGPVRRRLRGRERRAAPRTA